jgi:hypothetical protein
MMLTSDRRELGIWVRRDRRRYRYYSPRGSLERSTERCSVDVGLVARAGVSVWLVVGIARVG